MDENIKNKVREIQDKYCGEPVETKLYYAIEMEIEDIKTARRCIDFLRIKCNDMCCRNESCPLNKVYDSDFKPNTK